MKNNPKELSSRKTAWTPALLIATYLLLGLAVAVITPYGQFPDEEDHLAYVKYVRLHHRIPPLSFDPKQLPVIEGFQPPLHYLVAAPLISLHWSESTMVFVLRCFSLLLGAGTIWLIWKTALLVFTDPRVAWLSTSFAAWNPQFIFSEAGINNNPMAAFTSSLTLFCCVRFLLRNGNAWWIGISFGLAILSRQVAAYLLPVCLWIFYIRWKEDKRPLMELVRTLSIFAFASFAIAGWYYLRNWIYYGDPALLKMTRLAYPQFLRAEPVTIHYLLYSIGILNASYWAYFGLHQLHAGILEYSIYLLLQLIAIVGILENLRRHPSALSGPAQKIFLMLIGAAVLGILEIIAWQFRVWAPQGRYLYIVILPISLLLGFGIHQVFPEKLQRKGAVGLSIFLLLFGVYLLARYWLPHYT